MLSYPPLYMKKSVQFSIVVVICSLIVVVVFCCRQELVVLVDNIVRESLLLSVYANIFEKFAAAAVVLGNR